MEEERTVMRELFTLSALIPFFLSFSSCLYVKKGVVNLEEKSMHGSKDRLKEEKGKSSTCTQLRILRQTNQTAEDVSYIDHPYD